MELIYTQAKARSPGNLEVALEMKKNDKLHFFFKTLVQIYLIGMFPWKFRGLIDRYSGVDHLITVQACNCICMLIV